MIRKFNPLLCKTTKGKKFLAGILVISTLWGCSNDDSLDTQKSLSPTEFIISESIEVLKMKNTFSDSILSLQKQKIGNNARFFLGKTDPPRQFVKETRNMIAASANSYYNNIEQQIKTHYSFILDQLIQRGTGAYTLGTDKTDLYLNNGFSKLRLSETLYWESRKDRTYHSYDIIRNLGPETRKITLQYVYNLLANAYSYPGYKLTPVPNALQGGTRLVFGSLTLVNNPNTYIIPGGIIEQQAIPGGVLNITTTEHTFYKGTIRKVVFKYKNNLFVVTHGEGINRFLNKPNLLINAALFSGFSKMNDSEGPQAFITLDQQILKALGR